MIGQECKHLQRCIFLDHKNNLRLHASESIVNYARQVNLWIVGILTSSMNSSFFFRFFVEGLVIMECNWIGIKPCFENYCQRQNKMQWNIILLSNTCIALRKKVLKTLSSCPYCQPCSYMNSFMEDISITIDDQISIHFHKSDINLKKTNNSSKRVLVFT